MNKMKVEESILITGATGFLGSNLLSSLVEHDRPVIVLKRTQSDLWRIQPWLDRVLLYDIGVHTFEEILTKNRIHTIVHCATDYGRRPVPATEIVEANLFLPLQLLQIAQKHGVHAFINTDTILDKRINFYSLSKHQFTEWLEVFSTNFVCANVALEHFYGPYDDPSKFVARIITDLLASKESIELTQGEQRRDFIFIDDVITAFLKIIEFCDSEQAGIHRFEVGSAKNISIREFVELVKLLTDNDTTNLHFGALPYRNDEVMESRVDISALSHLQWEPSVPLREGLAQTILLEKKRRAA